MLSLSSLSPTSEHLAALAAAAAPAHTPPTPAVRPLTESETKTLFAKLANYLGPNLVHLVDTPEDASPCPSLDCAPPLPLAATATTRPGGARTSSSRGGGDKPLQGTRAARGG